MCKQNNQIWICDESNIELSKYLQCKNNNNSTKGSMRFVAKITLIQLNQYLIGYANCSERNVIQPFGSFYQKRVHMKDVMRYVILLLHYSRFVACIHSDIDIVYSAANMRKWNNII